MTTAIAVATAAATMATTMVTAAGNDKTLQAG
jgi:hypothetical protein